MISCMALESADAISDIAFRSNAASLIFAQTETPSKKPENRNSDHHDAHNILPFRLLVFPQSTWLGLASHGQDCGIRKRSQAV